MLYALVRSSLVLTGLVLLGVGIGNLVAGSNKITQYEELVAFTAPRGEPDPAALFPAPSEREERHALARAKVAFYQLLVTAGELLTAFGAALIAIGIVRAWVRAPRAAPNSVASH